MIENGVSCFTFKVWCMKMEMCRHFGHSTISHEAAVNLSYFISDPLHSPRPWTQDGRPCIHGNTLFQHHPIGILRQEGVSKTACASRQLKRGGYQITKRYEQIYFPRYLSYGPSNLWTSSLSRGDNDDDEMVITCSRICNPMWFMRS